MATLQFLGATGRVTGSKHLVEVAGERVLVDCGLYQGPTALRLRNWERLPVEPASVDWSCSRTGTSITRGICRGSSRMDFVAPSRPLRRPPTWRRSCCRTPVISRRRRPLITIGAAPRHTLRHCRSTRPSKASRQRSAWRASPINIATGPILIISASGMATGGRVLHDLKQRLPDSHTSVLLVGYQAIATRGRQLQDGATSLRIYGEEIPVRAHVETIHGLSA